MAQETASPRQHSNAYNIFILVLTVLSLAVMVVLLLPLSDETIKLLSVYDNVICVIFLIDFFFNLKNAPKKSDYFIKERGWLDLLGSIPSLGLLTNVGKYAGLLRLARLSRLARIARLMRGENRKTLVKDVLEHRNQYAGFITILLTILVLTVASVLVLQFESQSPDAKITTGGDALLVCDRDDYHGGIWRLLPGHCWGTDHGHVHHVRRGWHHRRPGQYSRQPAGRRHRLQMKRRRPRLPPLHPRSNTNWLRSKMSWLPYARCWKN